METSPRSINTLCLISLLLFIIIVIIIWVEFDLTTVFWLVSSKHLATIMFPLSNKNVGNNLPFPCHLEVVFDSKKIQKNCELHCRKPTGISLRYLHLYCANSFFDPWGTEGVWGVLWRNVFYIRQRVFWPINTWVLVHGR